jgi:hypothetical protein
MRGAVCLSQTVCHSLVSLAPGSTSVRLSHHKAMADFCPDYNSVYDVAASATRSEKYRALDGNFSFSIVRITSQRVLLCAMTHLSNVPRSQLGTVSSVNSYQMRFLIELHMLLSSSVFLLFLFGQSSASAQTHDAKFLVPLLVRQKAYMQTNFLQQSLLEVDLWTDSVDY